MTPATQSEALRILRRDEGVRKHAYDDATGERVRAPLGVLTIGVGINLDEGLDSNEIDWLERNRMERECVAFASRYAHTYGERPTVLPEDAQLALALMAFQLGPARLMGFRKMLHAVAGRNFRRAAAEALDSKWDKQTAGRAIRVAKLFHKCADEAGEAK